MTFLNRCRISWHPLLVFGLVFLPSLQGQNRPVDRAIESWRQLLNVDETSDVERVEDRREDEEDPTSDTTPLGFSVQEIHLIAHQDDASKFADLTGTVVTIDSEIPAPAGLEAAMQAYIGEPASMALLSEIGKSVVMAWRDSDYPLVDVYFPEQNVTLGKIQLVVREALLGEKRANGVVFSDENYLLAQIRLEPGDRINARILDDDIDWLNENPSRQVNLVYERGEKDATSDIVLEVDEDKQLRAYAGFGNTGLTQTGENEFSFGFSIGNPFQQEQIAGYNYTTDEDWEFLRAHSAFYEAFLPWRHTFGILGAYVESDARNAAPLGIEGVSQQWTGRYKIPLSRPDFNRRWKHSVFLAFDYKTTDTDLLFGGASFFGTDIAIGQFRGGYEFSVPDKRGFTSVTAELVVSPGNMYGNNDDVSFGTARPGSSADYVYGIARVNRFVNLAKGFRLAADATAQWTGDRLASTEQLLGGGYNTVRGFDESVIRGDSGVIGSVELIAPEVAVCPSVGGLLSCHLFYDYAAFRVNDKIAGESSPSLQSVGLAVNLSFGETGFARAAYGWALDSHGVNPAFHSNGKFHFGMTLNY